MATPEDDASRRPGNGCPSRHLGLAMSGRVNCPCRHCCQRSWRTQKPQPKLPEAQYGKVGYFFRAGSDITGDVAQKLKPYAGRPLGMHEQSLDLSASRKLDFVMAANATGGSGREAAEERTHTGTSPAFVRHHAGDRPWNGVRTSRARCLFQTLKASPYAC